MAHWTSNLQLIDFKSQSLCCRVENPGMSFTPLDCLPRKPKTNAGLQDPLNYHQPHMISLPLTFSNKKNKYATPMAMMNIV